MHNKEYNSSVLTGRVTTFVYDVESNIASIRYITSNKTLLKKRRVTETLMLNIASERKTITNIGKEGKKIKARQPQKTLKKRIHCYRGNAIRK